MMVMAMAENKKWTRGLIATTVAAIARFSLQ
jgi:hypothetical protein